MQKQTQKEQREDAVRSVWWTIVEAGNDPTQTDDYTLDLICQERAASFIHNASDNQWCLFLREFHKRQQDEIAYQAHKARRAERRVQRDDWRDKAYRFPNVK